MKLIYQHMLSFLLIIVTTVSIIGYAEIDYIKNQTYSQNFQRMESYATTIGDLATSENNGKSLLSDDFLNKLRFVLQGDDVNFRIFNAQNQQIYPKTNVPMRLPAKVFRTLKAGKEIQIRNNNVERYIGQTKSAYTGVLVPWNHGPGNLVGIIWIGSTVRNVEKPIMMAKRNLINALIVTIIVGIILSFLLAYYSTSKIKRLSKATEKVAAGDFDVQIPHKNSDEIDHLASNFNYMVRKLKKSNEEIEAQEKRRDQFMADAAHEMRTPLTTINGILEGLEYDAIPEESKPKSIALMSRETKRLIRLVNENLDYEKIRNNQIILYKTKFDAAKVLKDVTAQLQQNAAKANDQLELQVTDEIPIYADQDRFTQIMVNLIQNAIQFTRDGKILVTGKRLEHAAQISVIDNGIGMSAEQRKYIFERFFKADPSRARLGTGESGLGLAIVSSLIKQHGGKITVTSEEGKGSNFTITIYDKGYEQFVTEK
ncbi:MULTISPECIES: HAMP domain-containing sensor histidine kinase [Lactobacillus]|uniref:histidine kinase n=1 Tax=Lactobacillus xujianguonis TaxID=2495899 RepID=A0A437SWD4_9LACO|nr:MULTISPECIES: HAMP domain-containing sensor histidine kinase [Lactobacillus]RVU71248.1 HAMP domain-containing histidine kinase [Lactobacillus xujianguonis]RVU74097.1 HAMP domain-containing histidine kinase [Lactobacillus xujianguonis]